MPIPSPKDVRLPLLREIQAAGGKVKHRDILSKVAAYFNLTPAEQAGEDFYRCLRRASWQSRNQGELLRERGVWTITPKGRARLGTGAIPPPPPPPQPPKHEQLKKAMVEIGDQLGYYTKTENGPVYRHDVLWHENEYANPNHVIEVCEGGLLPKDFDALHWASDKWRARGILVVTDDKDFAKAKSRFAGYTNVVVVKAETVEDLHRVAQQNPEFLRLIFGK